MNGRGDLPCPLIAMEYSPFTFRCLRRVYQEEGAITQNSRPQGSVWTLPTVNSGSLIILTLRKQSECQSLFVMKHTFQHRLLRSNRAIDHIERMINKLVLISNSR